MSQSSLKVIVKDPFEMPAVDDTTVLTLRECADLVPHCWIWNESVGYLEVVTYSGYDIYVTVKNVGMKENATSGTIFPSCMEFLITAPNATPIIDNTVTCLRADFKCPTVGQEALMSVDSTSAIRVGDIIIVDTRYQYLVTEIINEHTMKVLNEEKGKESGVIDVKCNECVPVKILESTHCCEALQDQVDDIYNRIDTKKSIIPDADSLISITNGSNSLTDANNDVVLDVDIDLSKYDNTVSKFTSLRYFKENTGGINAVFNPDRSTGYTNYDLGTNTDYFNNAYINKIQGGQGRSSFISLPIDGSDTMYSNGTMFSYNAHAFYSGGKKLVAFAHDQAEFSTKILPTSTSTYDLGGSTATWSNIYTDSITLNGTTYTSIPTVNDAKLTIYQSDGVTPFVEFTANASSAVTATLPASGNTYTATSPISIDANNDISISQASSTTDGYLSSTDWNTFNSKASSLVYFEEALSGTTAIWKPKSGSATTYELGVNNAANTFSKAYIEELHIRGIVNDLGNATIRINSNTTLAPSGSSSGGTLNSVNLGGSDYPFYEGWITHVKTNELKTVSGSNISVETNLVPSGSFDLGNSNNYWNNAYINNLYANNMGNYVLVTKQGMTFDFSAGGGTIPSDYTFLPGHYYSTYSTNTYTFSNVFSQPVHLEIMFNLNKFRLNISSGTGNNATYELHLWWEFKLYDTGGTVPGTWTSYQSFTAYCQTPSAASHSCTYSLANYASGEINIPSGKTVQIRLLFYFALISAQGTVRTYSGWGPSTNAKIVGWLTN